MTIGSTTIDLEALTSQVAQKQVIAYGDKITEVTNCDAYRVPQGWECEQLKADPDVVQVTSTVELEDAIQDRNVQTLFVPKRSALNEAMLKTVTDRNGQEKMIFWEV